MNKRLHTMSTIPTQRTCTGSRGTVLHSLAALRKRLHTHAHAHPHTPTHTRTHTQPTTPPHHTLTGTQRRHRHTHTHIHSHRCTHQHSGSLIVPVQVVNLVSRSREFNCR